MATARNLSWQDGYWWSNDGLRLHYRDYPGRADRPVVLCIPGLTRNARDFANLAERIAGDWRVIAIDLRGRAESAYAKDSMTYVPLTYVQDIEALLSSLRIESFIGIGTSLGGLVTLLLAATARERVAGVVLNDIGPTIEPAGLARIRGYVGRASVWPTWMHAARAVAEANADIYPDYQVSDWLAMAKRLYRLTSAGRIVLDYDLKIAEPLRVPGNESGFDMWPILDRIADIPATILRGAHSDILSEATAANMAVRLPNAAFVTVAGVGHAPTLDEPEAVAAIDALLARIAAEPADEPRATPVQPAGA